MIETARAIPGLLSGLISLYCPQQRGISPEWQESLRMWTDRLTGVQLIAAALVKYMALSTINATEKPFFRNLPITSIFDATLDVRHSAERFASQNNDPTRVEEYPALELLRVYDREPPEQDWPHRWMSAAEISGDRTALRVFNETKRLIALRSSPIWQALGDGAGGYSDALGNPFPPFAFKSGFDVNEVPRRECVQLGLACADQIQ